jgi:hypothetical protein
MEATTTNGSGTNYATGLVLNPATQTPKSGAYPVSPNAAERVVPVSASTLIPIMVCMVSACAYLPMALAWQNYQAR